MKRGKSNSGPQNQSHGGAAGAADSPETLLLIDLWLDQPDQSAGDASGQRPAGQGSAEGDAPVPLLTVPSSALAMVSDLLTIDGGELRDSTASPLTASFKESFRAVNSARHLQRLVRGFSRASVTGPFHASFTLMHAHEAAMGVAIGIQERSQTQPGQVLCVGSLCDFIRSIPGLQFTSPSTGSEASGNVLQLLPPMHMEGYVHEALEPRVSADMGKPLPMAAPSIVLPPVTISVEAEHSVGPLADKYSSGDINVPVKTFNPRWVIGGVAAAAVVGSILIFVPASKKYTPAAAQPDSAPSSQPSSPTPALPAPANNQPLTRTVQPAPARQESAAAKQKDAARTRSTPPPVPEQAEVEVPKTTSHGINFNSSEIEDLIVRADKDAGNGAYDRAILEYRTVLNRDPSNAAAKRGLAKALYNQSHQ